MPLGDGKKLVGLVLVFRNVAGIRRRRGGCSPAKIRGRVVINSRIVEAGFLSPFRRRRES